jgi:hypothetical protein
MIANVSPAWPVNVNVTCPVELNVLVDEAESWACDRTHTCLHADAIARCQLEIGAGCEGTLAQLAPVLAAQNSMPTPAHRDQVELLAKTGGTLMQLLSCHRVRDRYEWLRWRHRHWPRARPLQLVAAASAPPRQGPKKPTFQACSGADFLRCPPTKLRVTKSRKSLPYEQFAVMSGLGWRRSRVPPYEVSPSSLHAGPLPALDL